MTIVKYKNWGANKLKVKYASRLKTFCGVNKKIDMVDNMWNYSYVCESRGGIWNEFDFLKRWLFILKLIVDGNCRGNRLGLFDNDLIINEHHICNASFEPERPVREIYKRYDCLVTGKFDVWHNKTSRLCNRLL